MTDRVRPVRGLVGILLAFALLGGACGGDDDTNVVLPTASEAPEATVAPVPTATPDNSTDDGAAADDPTDDDGAAEDPTDDGAADDGIPETGSAIPTPTQGPIAGEPAFTAASKLTTVGLDELFFGDPVDFAAEVADTIWTGLLEEGSRPQCYTVQPQGGPAGIYFTVMDGFIERVDITNPIITTRSGAGVGYGETDLLALFGDSLEVVDIGGGSEITFVPSDPDDRLFRIIWVTDGQAVVSMRAGRTAIVTPSSPCG